MMKTFLYIVSLTALLLCSCRKKDFPETITTTESDFYFNGQIDGATVSLKAGIGGYYMYSSHAKDSTVSLYRYIADLKPADCNHCKNSIQVIIHDPRSVSTTEKMLIDSLLPGAYPLMGASFYEVKFNSLFNKNAAAYTWDFGDNSGSVDANPTHIYKTAGKYKVRLKIDSDNGCQQYIVNTEKIKYPFARPNIYVIQSSPNVMNFTTSLDSSYSFHWDFGDGTTSTSPMPSHGYNVSGTYPVILRTIKDHDTSYVRHNIATETNPMPCVSNYHVASVDRVKNPDLFSKVIINWTDEQGRVYTSDNFSQPEDSYVNVISVEDYDNNEKGERTKKIKLSFSCKVYYGNSVKTINNGEAVLSISYR